MEAETDCPYGDKATNHYGHRSNWQYTVILLKG